MDKCKVCPIRVNCDWLAEMCRLSDREVAQRPYLIRPLTRRERQIEAQRRWRAKNREKCRENDRIRYARNPHLKMQKVMDYQRRNPEKRAAAQRRYAEKKRQINHSLK